MAIIAINRPRLLQKHLPQAFHAGISEVRMQNIVQYGLVMLLAKLLVQLAHFHIFLSVGPQNSVSFNSVQFTLLLLFLIAFEA